MTAPIRWRVETGFEFRCESCVQRGGTTVFWPLTDEFWTPRHGMTKCRACQLDYWRKKQKRLRTKADYYATYYRKHRAELLAKRRAYYLRNWEAIQARARARYAAKKAAA